MEILDHIKFTEGSTSLNIANVSSDETELVFILDKFGPMFDSLIDLNLSNNVVGQKALQKMSHYLPSSLKILELGKCQLQPCHVPYLAETLKNLCSLEVLKLNSNRLGNSIRELVDVLPKLPLKELDLTRNHLTESDLVDIGECLRHTTTITALNLSQNKLSIDLTNFASSLSHNKSIKKLDMSGCFLGSEQIEALSKSFQHLSLHILLLKNNRISRATNVFKELESTQIQVLDLSNNSISSLEGITPVLRTLKKLLLNLNQIVSLKPIVKGISKSPLKKLNLSWNCISFVHDLISELSSNEQLKYLYLDHNPLQFTSEAAFLQPWIESLVSNNSLLELYISPAGHYITNKVKKFKPLFESNFTITTLKYAMSPNQSNTNDADLEVLLSANRNYNGLCEEAEGISQNLNWWRRFRIICEGFFSSKWRTAVAECSKKKILLIASNEFIQQYDCTVGIRTQAQTLISKFTKPNHILQLVYFPNAKTVLSRARHI